MTPRRGRITRRAALAGLGAATGALHAAAQTPAAPKAPPKPPFQNLMPVEGKAGPGLEPIDRAMLKIMDRHGLPGAALAIAKNGRLLLAKGYGWADLDAPEPVRPDTKFALASLSKTFTAVATLKLVEQGKFRLDDPILGLIDHIKPPPGARIDPRLLQVTVRQCLNHSGGWDRTVSGDPINWQPQICRAYKVAPPLSPAQFLSFMLTVPLDFNPGTNAKYSNVGFVMLGEAIARLTGQPYERFVTEQVLAPMGVRGAALQGFDGKYAAREAVRYLAGTLVTLPPVLLPMINATGGWSASVVDMARFLTNLEGSRGKPVLSGKARGWMVEAPPPPLKPRPDGTWFGLGWDMATTGEKGFGYYKDGSYQGMRTYMKRLMTGVSWVLLYNASMEFDPQDLQIAAGAIQEVHKLVEGIEKHPDVDLFEEFR
jgi:N-acyl-D-amino-acid deacylase